MCIRDRRNVLSSFYQICFSSYSTINLGFDCQTARKFALISWKIPACSLLDYTIFASGWRVHLFSWTEMNTVRLKSRYLLIMNNKRLNATNVLGTYIDGYFHQLTLKLVPSVLWRCWLGGRKGIRPVKNMDMEWWGAGMVICLEWGANDLHMVQLMPSSLASAKSRMVYPSGNGLPRLSWKKGRLTFVCVCVCDCVCALMHSLIQCSTEKRISPLCRPFNYSFIC